jgi:K+-transporting ATPase ATPase B chain
VLTARGWASTGFGWAVTAILLVTVLFAQLRRSGGRGAWSRPGGVAAPCAQGPDGAPGHRGHRRETKRPAAELRPAIWWCLPASRFRPTARSSKGLATINESAVTGESAPVLREAGTDRSGVIGGTKVLSDEIVVRITAEPGTASSTA